MLSLDNLPEEITLQVFERLCQHDMVNFILHLEEVEPCRKRHILLERCFKRLYGGTIVIHNAENPEVSNKNIANNEIKEDLNEYNHFMQIDKFISKFELNNQASQVFCSTRPKRLEFSFIRSANDYTNFLNGLEKFNNFIKDLILKENPKFSQYFKQVHHVSLKINGRSVLVENPSSVIVSIMRVLISMAGNGNPFKEKLRTLDILSTDLGEHFQGEWNKILSRFENLDILKLSENMLSLRFDDININLDQRLHIHPLYTTWPPNIKELSINDNYFHSLSSEFMNSLPQLIEKLLIAGNYIVSFGYFNDLLGILIGKILPHLKYLDLSRNKLLSRINSDIFTSQTNSIELDIRETNLEPDVIDQLKRNPFLHLIE